MTLRMEAVQFALIVMFRRDVRAMTKGNYYFVILFVSLIFLHSNMGIIVILTLSQTSPGFYVSVIQVF